MFGPSTLALSCHRFYPGIVTRVFRDVGFRICRPTWPNGVDHIHIHKKSCFFSGWSCIHLHICKCIMIDLHLHLHTCIYIYSDQRRYIFWNMIPQQRNTYDVLLVTNSYKDPVADSGLSTGRTLGASLVTFQHFLLLSLAWYSCCSLCQQCLATNLESDIDGRTVQFHSFTISPWC